MGEASKALSAESVIGKYSLKKLDLQYLVFPVEQNIDGKVVKVRKQLALEGLGMKVVHSADVASTMATGLKRIDKDTAESLRGKIRRPKKGDRHRIIVSTAHTGRFDKKLIDIVIEQLERVKVKEESLVKGTIDTGSLSATTRKVLRQTILDRYVLNIIANGGYDDELLRPFLDFNYELPKEIFKKVVRKCGFNTTQWAEIIGVNGDRINSSRAFNHQQSMHILKILLLFNHSFEVFNDKAYFKRWLKKKSVDLGNTPPYFYLDSPSGIDVVRKRLDRIDAGIFS